MKKALLAFGILSFLAPAVSFADTTVLNDDFVGSIVNSLNWHIPTWVSSTDGTYIGRTQFRVTQNSALPSATTSAATITLETYNPTGFSFYGTDLISNQSYSVGTGVDVKFRAKINGPVTPGTVGGLFLYALKPGSTTLHDEIDFELLGTRPGEVQTNIYGNEPFGAGHPTFVALPTGTIGDYHTYDIKWLAGQVSWYVDGTLVRTTTSNVPSGPMSIHLNMWAPDTGWAEAYSPTIQATNTPSSNQLFSMGVDSVIVTSLSAPATLKSITLTKATSVVAGQTRQLTATSKDTNNAIVTPPLTWTSSDPNIASVSSTGLVSGFVSGTTTITATSGTVVSNPSTVTVTVNPVIKISSTPAYGATTNVSGTATGVTSREYAVALYIKVFGYWWSKPYMTAPLTEIQPNGSWSNGVMSGGDDAKFSEVRAYLVPKSFALPVIGNYAQLPASLSAYKYVSVTRKAPLARILINASSTALVVGNTAQFTASGINAVGDPVAVAPKWKSSNPLVATASTTGLITALKVGTTTISATSGTIVESSTVWVGLPPPPPAISITSMPAFETSTIVSGTTAGVNSSDYDVALFIKVGNQWWTKPYGNAPLTAITADGSWSANVVTGGRDNLFTDVRAYLIPKTDTVPMVFGQSSLPATLAPYLSASATRSIPAVGMIIVNPRSAMIAVGDTLQMSGELRDFWGNATTTPTTLTWSSADPTVATVDQQSGLVTGIAPGSSLITATDGGLLTQTYGSTVTVQPLP